MAQTEDETWPRVRWTRVVVEDGLRLDPALSTVWNEVHHQYVVSSPPPEPWVDEAILEYLAEPDEPPAYPQLSLREVCLRAFRLARAPDSSGAAARPPIGKAPGTAWAGVADTPRWLKLGLSARFFRPVDLPSGSLATTLAEWWARGARDGVVTVARRLRLGSPRGDPGCWTMDGRVRRLTRWHWVPVVVELWPVHDHWIMTMTPQARVIASQRYFRTGNLVLDRLTAELADQAAGRASGRAYRT